VRNIYAAFLLLLLPCIAFAQTISVSGRCISGTSTLNKVADEAGRVAYQGTGTVDGNTGVSISIFWIGAPDNVWVLAFDGQPYFSNACNRSTPPSTSTAGCPWTALDGSCTGTALSVVGTGTLPIQISSFIATKAGGQVQLSWTTASETNNKGFNVQRSQDGANWVTIGFVNGAGQSAQERAYRYTDAVPLKGKNYYRLLQVDFDNRSSASTVVVADIAGKLFYTLQHAGNGYYRLLIDAGETVALKVVDLNGKKLVEKTAAQGLQEIDLSSYANGVYLLQLQKDNRVLTEKLIKQ
jgi:hypothetical protein